MWEEGVRIYGTPGVYNNFPQSEGNYAEALQNYYEAMRLEIDPYDRSYILYNIGLIFRDYFSLNFFFEKQLSLSLTVS